MVLSQKQRLINHWRDFLRVELLQLARHLLHDQRHLVVGERGHLAKHGDGRGQIGGGVPFANAETPQLTQSKVGRLDLIAIFGQVDHEVLIVGHAEQSRQERQPSWIQRVLVGLELLDADRDELGDLGRAEVGLLVEMPEDLCDHGLVDLDFGVGLKGDLEHGAEHSLPQALEAVEIEAAGEDDFDDWIGILAARSNAFYHTLQHFFVICFLQHLGHFILVGFVFVLACFKELLDQRISHFDQDSRISIQSSSNSSKFSYL